MKTALIGDIGRYALHDGPGMRTTVFFKGCTLHCPWCHNPEYIAAQAEIACHPERCIGCGDCRETCLEGAVSVDPVVQIDRQRCTGCGRCTAVCPARALDRVGREYETEALIEILLRDRRFYEASNGGVTLSGGEATGQMGFCGDLLERLKQEGIHTAIETSGFFVWERFQRICLPHLDLILWDLKLADPDRHRQVVGVDNGPILSNLKRLLKKIPDRVIVRVPLIPGYTADRKNLMQIADLLLHGHPARRCSLLPYHPMGRGKAETIGRSTDATLPRTPLDAKTLSQCRQYFNAFEIVDP